MPTKMAESAAKYASQTGQKGKKLLIWSNNNLNIVYRKLYLLRVDIG